MKVVFVTFGEAENVLQKAGPDRGRSLTPYEPHGTKRTN